VLSSTGGLILAAAFLVSIPLWTAMRGRGYSHATKMANMKSVALAFALQSLAMAASLVAGLPALAGLLGGD
jgi:hypothetical protein